MPADRVLALAKIKSTFSTTFVNNRTLLVLVGEYAKRQSNTSQLSETNNAEKRDTFHLGGPVTSVKYQGQIMLKRKRHYR